MFSKKQFYLAIILVASLSSLLSLVGLRLFFGKAYFKVPKYSYQFKDSTVLVPAGMNFVYSAEAAVPTVVHIKTSYQKRKASNDEEIEDMFRQFHGKNWQPRTSSGSGVLVSEDGYIVTNNHVVENTDEIEVTLYDKRTYEATLIGTDPSTDLALLKIEEDELPFLPYANSEKVRVGEWVLAVGNPFELNSTVTAGIISAKSRNINLIQDKDNLQIEAFLQTDASVNPGNSGGALVNLKGELVGINTAIASETGTFQGYSFAVPSNLVRKVIEDLQKYGEVQRALMGVEILDVNAALAKEKNLEVIEGVYVAGVSSKGAAAEAGIQKGDVITEVDGRKVNSRAELQVIVASKRPGETVWVAYKHQGTEKKVKITLKNPKGTLEIVQKADYKKIEVLGAELQNPTEEEKERLNLKGGAKVVKIKSGKLLQAGIEKGFFITHISQSGKRVLVQSAAHALAIVQQDSKHTEGIYIEGIYENGDKAYYPIGW